AGARAAEPPLPADDGGPADEEDGDAALAPGAQRPLQPGGRAADQAFEQRRASFTRRIHTPFQLEASSGVVGGDRGGWTGGRWPGRGGWGPVAGGRRSG